MAKSKEKKKSSVSSKKYQFYEGSKKIEKNAQNVKKEFLWEFTKTLTDITAANAALQKKNNYKYFLN